MRMARLRPGSRSLWRTGWPIRHKRSDPSRVGGCHTTGRRGSHRRWGMLLSVRRRRYRESTGGMQVVFARWSPQYIALSGALTARRPVGLGKSASQKLGAMRRQIDTGWRGARCRTRSVIPTSKPASTRSSRGRKKAAERRQAFARSWSTLMGVVGRLNREGSLAFEP